MIKNLLIIIFSFEFILASYDFENCKCRYNTARILNGDKVTENKYPFQVAIVHLTSYHQEYYNLMNFLTTESYKLHRLVCSGVIVNENTILTTAYCVKGYSEDVLYKNLVVMAGSNNRINQFELGFWKIIDYSIHESYRSKTLENDIAVIKIDPPFVFNDKIQPACFYFNLYKGLYTNLTTSGWGSSEQVDKNSVAKLQSNLLYEKELKEINMIDITKNNYCKRFNNYISTFCAKNAKKNESICYGDIGGPLVYTENSNIYVVGISSYLMNGFNNDLCQGIAVFTRISFYHRFLRLQSDYKFCVVD